VVPCDFKGDAISAKVKMRVFNVVGKVAVTTPDIMNNISQ
jgi:hypothetical protein